MELAAAPAALGCRGRAKSGPWCAASRQAAVVKGAVVQTRAGTESSVWVMVQK